MLRRPRSGKTWRNWLGVVSLLVCFLSSSLTSADMKYIPHWQRMACGADLYACYTFEQAQLILIIDLEFQDKAVELKKSLADIVDLKLINSKYATSLRLMEENQKRFETRIAEKNDLLEENIKLTRRLVQRDIFGEAFPWVILSLVVVVAGGFAGGYLLAD